MDFGLQAAPHVQELSPADALARARAGALLLDCREPDEVAIAHIAGSRHIPMGDIPSRLTELDPDAEIIVYCHEGVRSWNVAAFLAKQDFTNVKSLRGGIDAWSREVDPTVPRY